MSLEIENINPKSVNNIEINWLYHTGEDAGKFEVYRFEKNSIKVDRETECLRFMVKGISFETAKPFEIIIRQTKEGYVFKSDTYDDPADEYDLYLYECEKEAIFYAVDDDEEIYIHVEFSDRM